MHEVGDIPGVRFKVVKAECHYFQELMCVMVCFSMGFPSHILGSPAPRPARPGQDRGETLTTFFLRCVDWPINGKCHQREKWEPSHGWTLEWLRKN